MQIAILGGGGAMGGIFGGYLARAGNDVTLIDVSKAAVQAINDNGLTIEEKDGSPAGDPRAGERPIRRASARSTSSSISSNATTPRRPSGRPRR